MIQVRGKGFYMGDFENREWLADLKLRLSEAEASRLAGEPASTIAEARSWIEKKYVDNKE